MNWTTVQRMKNSVRILAEDETLNQIEIQIRKADIVIDAIFGTGIKGEIRRPHSRAIDAINASRAYVLAVDIPSGLDPNTGSPANKCIKANATITFHRLKSGMNKGRMYTGLTKVVPIGIPPEAEEGIV